MTKEKLITKLQLYVSVLEELEEDEEFNPQDTYGGNYDDCYYGGERTGMVYGRAQVAEEVLKFLSTLT